MSDDFAEFDFEEDEDGGSKKEAGDGKVDAKPEPPRPKIVDNDDDDEEEAVVEDEDSEFNHFEDEEEFEGWVAWSSRITQLCEESSSEESYLDFCWYLGVLTLK